MDVPWILIMFVLACHVMGSGGEVVYVCLADGDSLLSLGCPSGQGLRIQEALYGRSPWGLCRLLSGPGESSCTQPTNTPLDCCGHQHCQQHVQPAYLPACGYPTDFLRVVYECIPVAGATIRCGPDVPAAKHPSVGASYHVQSNPSPGGVPAAEEPLRPTVPMSVSVENTTAELDYELSRDPYIRQEPKNTIKGYDAVAVWSILGVGLVIIVFLSALLAYLWRRRPVAEKANNDTADSEVGPNIQESGFCRSSPEGGPRKLGGATSNKTGSDTGGHVNDGYDIESEIGDRRLSRKRKRPGKGGSPSVSLRSSNSNRSSTSLRSVTSRGSRSSRGRGVVKSRGGEDKSITDSGVEVSCNTSNLSQTSQGSSVSNETSPGVNNSTPETSDSPECVTVGDKVMI